MSPAEVRARLAALRTAVRLLAQSVERAEGEITAEVRENAVSVRAHAAVLATEVKGGKK